MSAVQTILTIILMLVSLVMIISVLLQKGDEDGIAALGGSSSQDSHYGKNKGKTAAGKLASITKASAVVFVALTLIMLFVK